jgi:glycosyltransferase involved in cell wall biosynthesis
MKISIIIPVYNSSLTLKECLDVVFGSNFNNFEVIIVSDNSSDNSVKIAKQYQCKIIELSQNKGPAFARNRGAQEAEGDILLFLDSDVVIKKEALKYLSDKFFDDEINAIQGIYSHEPVYKNMATQYQQSYTSYYIWPENKKYATTLSTCCFAIRKKIFTKFKGFDANIKRATCEDEVFGYDLINKGYKILISRELNVEHRVHYNIGHFIKRTFNRYTSTIKFYLRSKTFINKIRQTNYLKIIIGIPILGLIILTSFLIIFFQNKIIWLILLILNIIFLSLHAGFMIFVGRTKGSIKAIGVMIICYLDTFMMLTGTIYGYLSYFFGKKY